MSIAAENKGIFSLFSSEQESEEDSAKALELVFFGSGILEMLNFLADGEELEEDWKGHFEKVGDLLEKAQKGEKVIDKLMVKGFKLTDLDDVRALKLFQELNRFSINHDEKYSQRWAERLKKTGDWDKAHINLLMDLQETNSKILKGEKLEKIGPEKLADFESTFKSMDDLNMNKLAKPVDRFIVMEPFFKGK